jgi:voltage-gated potassium channel
MVKKPKKRSVKPVRRKQARDHLFKKMQREEDDIDRRFERKAQAMEASFWKRVHRFFRTHMDNYASPHGRRIEGTLFVLNFIVIILFIIDTHPIPPLARRIVATLEVSIVLVFVVEYTIRMWVAEHKVRHFFSIYSIIDLLSIVPILAHLGNLAFFRIFRILRLFRMLRILRFQRIFKQKDTMFGVLTDTQIIIIRIILTVFTIIFVSSGLIWAVESRVNPDYGTIWDAMYFSVVTLSTVGYGDVTPLSPLGKVITIGMILSGIALIPWQLGKLIKVLFVSSMKVEVKCSQCGLEHHEPDAIHCKRCGTILKKREEE